MIDHQKVEELTVVAEALYGRSDMDWIRFFRVLFGSDGLVRSFFKTVEELAEFERTDAYQQIQQMLAKLRERNWETPLTQEPTKVITVRIPESLHETLRTEAFDYHTSVNKLCISKLMRLIDSELVPPDIRTKKRATGEGPAEPGNPPSGDTAEVQGRLQGEESPREPVRAEVAELPSGQPARELGEDAAVPPAVNLDLPELPGSVGEEE